MDTVDLSRFLRLDTLAWVALALLVLVILLKTLRYIPNTRVGIVEKLASTRGSVKKGLIALAGEAGFQPELLCGGWHVLMPFLYRIHKVPLVTIPQGKVGYVFARDGQDLPPAQAMASNVRRTNFQDVRAFLESGGQKGPQRMILREGTYAINTRPVRGRHRGSHHLFAARFVAKSKPSKKWPPSSPNAAGFSRSSFAAPTTPSAWRRCTTVPRWLAARSSPPPSARIRTQARAYHNNFQDADKFLVAGGLRGRQYQVLVEGTYYINRLFATVELIAQDRHGSGQRSAWW